MSRTYKDIIRGKTRRESKEINLNGTHLEWNQLWTHLAHLNQDKIIWNANRNPSWWNRLQTTKKSRRKTHIYCQQIKDNSNPDFKPDIYVFPLARKPMIWYW